MRVLPDKIPKMQNCLEEWILGAFTTARGLAKIRGKAMHFSLGIRHLRVLIPEISLVMGTELDPEMVTLVSTGIERSRPQTQ